MRRAQLSFGEGLIAEEMEKSSKRKQEMIFRLYRAGARTGFITARFGPIPHASIVIIKPQRRRPLPAGSGSRGCHDPL
jgi:hypothetical protein